MTVTTILQYLLDISKDMPIVVITAAFYTLLKSEKESKENIDLIIMTCKSNSILSY